MMPISVKSSLPDRLRRAGLQLLAGAGGVVEDGGFVCMSEEQSGKVRDDADFLLHVQGAFDCVPRWLDDSPPEMPPGDDFAPGVPATDDLEPPMPADDDFEPAEPGHDFTLGVGILSNAQGNP